MTKRDTKDSFGMTKRDTKDSFGMTSATTKDSFGMTRRYKRFLRNDKNRRTKTEFNSVGNGQPRRHFFGWNALIFNPLN
jgi:hypothetical protein